MYWRVEYIILIVLSTTIDYNIAKRLSKLNNPRVRKNLLLISIASNLTLLLTFKYLDFIITSINGIFSTHIAEIGLILPVGISFYTFQTMSYTIDVFNKRFKAVKDLSQFSLFVCFFPQLVAGPIERSKKLIPQLRSFEAITWNNFRRGSRLILYGLFKKVVIADRLAYFVDLVFDSPQEYAGFQVAIAIVFFAFQIYCDFSGYSDIAIGVARIFGVRLTLNFNKPYLSSSVTEFWRRWHITLSTWFRDYVYIPLGGNKRGYKRSSINLLITFAVSGLWHGANWTFIIWGVYHGVIVFLERLGSKYINISTNKVIMQVFTFIVVCIGWVFFRANSYDDIVTIFSNLLYFDPNTLSIDMFQYSNRPEFLLSFAFIGLLVLEEIYIKKFILLFRVRYKHLKHIYLIILFLFILFFGIRNEEQFIYFQF
ncbi:MBOAT family O-acyltransferase [Ekhidna sp.]|uniref:MBOAT family O-acyltransferase n=1 Tax=Ekhidna sp. TaxID=2608089 RepID=UPI003CCC41B2